MAVNRRELAVDSFMLLFLIGSGIFYGSQQARIRRIQAHNKQLMVSIANLSKNAHMSHIEANAAKFSAEQKVAWAQSELHNIPTKAEKVIPWHPGKWRSFVATWYAQTGTTASGVQTHDYLTAAADPSVLPMGTVIQVKFRNGDTRVYQVQDTGALVHGTHVDLFYHSRHKDMVNGRQPVKLRVLAWG